MSVVAFEQLFSSIAAQAQTLLDEKGEISAEELVKTLSNQSFSTEREVRAALLSSGLIRGALQSTHE